MRKTILVVSMVLLFMPGVGHAADFYVNAEEGNDLWSGASSIQPKATIQAAIDAAVAGETIAVADGIYRGFGNRDIDFGGKNIILQSENGPANCIIDCGGTSQEPHRGFIFENGEDANCLVDGFTITNGYQTSGGAIRCLSSGPTITNCVIRGNQARGGGPGVNGGAISCGGDSDLFLSNTRISNNVSDNWGGGIHCDEDSSITIVNCIVNENTAGNYGGGIYCMNDSTVTVVNCTIIDNFAELLGGGLRGVGDSMAVISSSIFWANSIGDPTVGTGLTQIDITETADIDLSYSDVQGAYVSHGLFAFDVNDVAHFALGKTNIAYDPCFITDPELDPNGTPDDPCDDFWVDHYQLGEESRCRNTGNNDAIEALDIDFDIEGYPRIVGSAVDMGAYEMAIPDGPDLTGAFGVIALPSPIVPGDKGKAPIVISNIGNERADNRIDIGFYLSTDVFFDDNDTTIGMLNNKRVKLDPNAAKTLKVKLVIPPSITAGDYYLLAKIDVDNVIAESDESYNSNVVVGDLYELAWEFGNVEGRGKRVKLRVVDANEVPVVFTLSGEGWGEVEGNSDFDSVVLNDTDESSKLSIKTKGRGAATSIGDIVVNGSLKSITAKTTDLRGNISVTGSLRRLVLRDVLGGVPNGHLISILASSSDAKEAVSMKLRRVEDLSVYSPEFPIKSITATEWIDGEGLFDDDIETPWLGKLTIKGNARAGIAGDFQAGLLITGGASAPKGIALKSAKIAGIVSEVDWRITGDVGSITVGGLDNCLLLIGGVAELEVLTGSLDDFDDSESALKSLKVKGSGGVYFRDTELAAWEIGSVKIPSDAIDVSGFIEYFQARRVPVIPDGIDIDVVDLGVSP